MEEPYPECELCENWVYTSCSDPNRPQDFEDRCISSDLGVHGSPCPHFEPKKDSDCYYCEIFHEWWKLRNQTKHLCRHIRELLEE